MKENKKKGKQDERIVKESNRLAGKMFYLMSVLLLISLVVKCTLELPFYVYALEIIILAAGVVCFLLQEIRMGILFVKKKDEVLSELHSKATTTALMTEFWILVMGEGILVILCTYISELEPYFWWFASYLLILFPVSLIVLIFSIKKGWFVRVESREEKSDKKSEKKHVIARLSASALMYGILMEVFFGFGHVYYNGAFHAEGLLWIFGMAAAWGVMFYFGSRVMIKISEKKADQRLKEAEIETDEQGGDCYEE